MPSLPGLMDTDKTTAKSSFQLFHRQFHDADEVTQFMSVQREYRVLPLSLKPLQLEIHRADFGGLAMNFAEVHTTVQSRGERRPGFISFTLPLATGERLSYMHGQPFNVNTLGGFDVTRSIDNVFQQNLRLCALYVRHDVLEATLAMMQRDDIDDRFFKQDMIQLPTTLARYRSYMQELIQLIKQRSPLLQDPDFCQLIADDVLPLLIDAIPRQAPPYSLRPAPRQATQLVRRARDYIAGHIHEPLTLKDLYTALGVSRRTLFYSFENVFGLTPMEYIKVQRLQGLHQSLLAAEPTTTKVTTLARKWGFWHSGQLAKDYKTMFGELPSATLQKS